MKTLPNDSKMRYHYPISSGCLAYFPAAIAGVAKHSYIGGAKYNDGALVHLRYISNNHLDCVGRHLLDLQDLIAAQARGETTVETYIYDFTTKCETLVMLPIEEAILIECNAMCWRSLAISQELHEKLGKTPLAPAARLTPEPPPYVRLLDIGKNTVSVVKAVRAVANLGLKEALNIVRGTLPANVPVQGQYTTEQSRRLFIEAGAIIE